MKSVLVIGLGRFGRHLALKMAELKNDVLIIDRKAEIIEELAPHFDDAQIGDCTNENVLRSLGINNFDICFVAIGKDFQSSLEVTALLHELGARQVVSRANSDIHAKFLLRNGADEVVYPEREIAERCAVSHNSKNILNYTELTDQFSLFEIPIPPSWEGNDISSLAVRKKHQVNILAVKNGEDLHQLPGPEYEFRRGDHIIIVGHPDDVYKLSSKT